MKDNDMARKYVLEGVIKNLETMPDAEFREIMMGIVNSVPLYLLLKICKGIGKLNIECSNGE